MLSRHGQLPQTEAEGWISTAQQDQSHLAGIQVMPAAPWHPYVAAAVPRAATFEADVMVSTESAMKGQCTGTPLPKMTLAEYMAWKAEQPDRHEFYRGETFAMVDGTSGHNRVIVNLTRRIDAHLAGTACHVFSRNMKLQLADEGCFYQASW
jgi:hypothetical protein